MWTLRLTQGSILVVLVVIGLGPLVWLAKAAVSSSQDTLVQPLSLFPSGVVHWENLTRAWGEVQVGRHLVNSLIAAAGSAFFTVFVAVTGGFVLAILRPRWARVLTSLLMVTLFIPGVVALVPLFQNVVSLPVTGGSIMNTYWAVWLPAAASAFFVLIVKRFFESLPRELFDAARIDGADPPRLLLYIVLPLSRPIIGVTILLTLIGSYRDYLWPLLVLNAESVRPISVALVTMTRNASLGELMAALLLSVLLPIALFLAFQRQFLSGIGTAGSLKG
jgi:multiple sugar transport system permease protein